MKKVFLFFSLAFIISCNKEKIDTKTIVLDDFNTIILNSSFDIILSKSTTNYIEISADENMIEDIVIEDYLTDTLMIKNEFRRKWLHPKTNTPKLTIYYKSISLIKANSTCYIETNNPIKEDYFGLILSAKTNTAYLELDCKNLYYWNNYPCGGLLTLYGKADHIQLWNDALMSINAENLVAKKAFIDNTSKGDIQVNVTDSLTYNIYGSGNIILSNTTEVIKKEEVTGTGSLFIN